MSRPWTLLSGPLARLAGGSAIAALPVWRPFAMSGRAELTRGYSTGPKGWVDFAERLLELEDPSV